MRVPLRAVLTGRYVRALCGHQSSPASFARTTFDDVLAGLLTGAIAYVFVYVIVGRHRDKRLGIK